MNVSYERVIDYLQNMKFEGDLLSTQDTIDQQKIYFWQQLACLITPSVSRVVEFAKRVPGIEIKE